MVAQQLMNINEQVRSHLGADAPDTRALDKSAGIVRHHRPGGARGVVLRALSALTILGALGGPMPQFTAEVERIFGLRRFPWVTRVYLLLFAAFIGLLIWSAGQVPSPVPENF